MDITFSKIKGLRERAKHLAYVQESVSNRLKELKEGSKEKTHKIIREGKEIEITEDKLWQELYYSSEPKNQAREILGEKYPDLFVMAKEDEKLAQELNDYCVREFHLVFSQMRLVDLFELIEAFVIYEFYRFTGLGWVKIQLIKAKRFFKK